MQRPSPVFIAAAALAALICTANAAEDSARVQLWEEAYLRTRPGTTVQALFHLSIAPGYVVVASGVQGASRLRPMQLRMKETAGIKLGTPAYPAPQRTASVPGLPDFQAYQDTLAVRVPVTVPSSPDWSRREVQGVLEYQACDARRCLPSASLPVKLEVEIRPDRDDQG
jgi:DsbC/DsbD-like thiol-disulfide interchange protein